MAQFGKHFFGSSYFGRTSAFSGAYETSVIDAGEPFQGSVRLELTGTKPTQTYGPDNVDWLYSGTDWTVTNNSATTSVLGAKMETAVCASTLTLLFEQAPGNGTATVIFRNVLTDAVETQTIDTASSFTATFNGPYADYLVTVETTSALPVQISRLVAAVSEIGVEIRTATAVTSDNIYNWTDYLPLPTEWLSGSPEEAALYAGESAAIASARYVQLRLNLATSDATAGPTVSVLDVSGILTGDTGMKKRADNGFWYAALDMTRIAADAGVTFAYTYDLTWKESKHEASYLSIRSASLTDDELTAIPTGAAIVFDDNWKAETAPYVVEWDGVDYQTYARLSLAEAGNYGATESSTSASVFTTALSPKKASALGVRSYLGFSNRSEIEKWTHWDDQSFYPTHKNGTSIRYQIFDDPTDVALGYGAEKTITNPAAVLDRSLGLSAASANIPLYLRVSLTRNLATAGSPVVDYVDLVADIGYTSILKAGTTNFTDELSPLDNANNPAFQRGQRELRTITSGAFDWPAATGPVPENKRALQEADKTMTILYSPRFPGQVELYFKKKEGTPSDRYRAVFKGSASYSDTICSLVSCATPAASTVSVSEENERKLYWHYAYDGGRVYYPAEASKELPTTFTPKLESGQKYQFLLANGWPDKTAILPRSMTWEEAADFTSSVIADLQDKNVNVHLYNSLLPMGIALTLPNTSGNSLVSLRFASNSGLLTKKSTWNGALENETIVAALQPDAEHQYEEWVSEEKFYTAYLNPNNQWGVYQKIQYAADQPANRQTYTVKEGDSYASIANQYGLAETELRAANGNRTLSAGATLNLVQNLALPEIDSGILVAENPYTIEIIPGSVVRSDNGAVLADAAVVSGYKEIPGLQYTTTVKGPITYALTRDDLAQGTDSLSYSNTLSVTAVKSLDGSITYIPYNEETETGDYRFSREGNVLDWSPAQEGGREPAAGETYLVTCTYGIVDSITLTFSSGFVEHAAFDKLWRSKEIKTLTGSCTPEQDFYQPLTDAGYRPEDFAGYEPQRFTDVGYLVEDNDLWVKTTIVEIEGVPYLRATMNGEDPARNWYPTIQTGFYYLGAQEYYLYSEPIVHTFGNEAIPIIRNAEQSEDGLKLHLITA